MRESIIKMYSDSVFNLEDKSPPPVRGPFGEATIELKPGSVPVKQRRYQIHGPRGEAWKSLIDKLVEDGKVEDGVSAWSSPSFPVPKSDQESLG